MLHPFLLLPPPALNEINLTRLRHKNVDVSLEETPLKRPVLGSTVFWQKNPETEMAEMAEMIKKGGCRTRKNKSKRKARK